MKLTIKTRSASSTGPELKQVAKRTTYLIQTTNIERTTTVYGPDYVEFDMTMVHDAIIAGGLQSWEVTEVHYKRESRVPAWVLRNTPTE